MIKIVLALLLFASSAFGLTWTYVGTNSFTGSAVNYFDMAYSLSNELYLIYSETNNNFKATLSRFTTNTNVWIPLSTAFTPNQANQFTLFVDTNQYSYGPTNLIFPYIFTNYTFSTTISNTNNGSSYFTNYYTNFSFTNVNFLTNTYILVTNRGFKPSIVFSDRSKLFKASYMQYNGTISNTWSTNFRGFTPDAVGDVKAIFVGGGLIIASNMSTNPYLSIFTNGYTNIFVNSLGSPIFATNAITNLLNLVSSNFYTDIYFYPTVSDSNNVVAVFSDKSKNYKANVMQLTNTGWNFLGTNIGLSSNTVFYPSACQDTNGYFYIAFQDVGYGFKPKVLAYTNGGQWHSISVTNITNKGDYPILKTFKGNFYLAFNDLTLSRVSVYSYTNAGRWFPLGNANFSAGRGTFVDMQIWTNGNITVAYSDQSTNGFLSVMKYTNGGNWFSLGRGITGPVYNLKLKLDQNGNPVVGYKDNSTFGFGKLSVVQGQ